MTYNRVRHKWSMVYIQWITLNVYCFKRLSGTLMGFSCAWRT